MKTISAVLLLSSSLSLSAVLFAGCAATRPPSPVERSFYDIKTNTVEVVVTKTNVINQTNVIERVVEHDVTNLFPVVTSVTNVTHATNAVASYDLTPNEKAAAVQNTAGLIGNFWGVGGIASGVLGLLFGLYGQWRSSRSNKTAGALAQIIETGRALLQTTPQGKALDGQWKSWMIEHQAEAGVITEVGKLMQNVVDDKSAQIVAAQLLALMERAPAPVPQPK